MRRYQTQLLTFLWLLKHYKQVVHLGRVVPPNASSCGILVVMVMPRSTHVSTNRTAHPLKYQRSSDNYIFSFCSSEAPDIVHVFVPGDLPKWIFRQVITERVPPRHVYKTLRRCRLHNVLVKSNLPLHKLLEPRLFQVRHNVHSSLRTSRHQYLPSM